MCRFLSRKYIRLGVELTKLWTIPWYALLLGPCTDTANTDGGLQVKKRLPRQDSGLARDLTIVHLVSVCWLEELANCVEQTIPSLRRRGTSTKCAPRCCASGLQTIKVLGICP